MMSPNHSSTGAFTALSQDHALKGILLVNGVNLIIALWQDWSVLQLLWPFWIQSVIIGWFARQRILSLTEFCTEGLQVDGRFVEPTEETQRKSARDFGLHFGFFHAVYLIFLLVFTLGADPQGFLEVSDADTGEVFQVYVGTVYARDLLFFFGLAVGFWMTHQASHREHSRNDLDHAPSLGALIFLPYARVVPMHLCILLAIPLGGDRFIWLFILLKTAADAIMHVVEHRVLQRNESTNASDGEPASARAPSRER